MTVFFIHFIDLYFYGVIYPQTSFSRFKPLLTPFPHNILITAVVSRSASLVADSEAIWSGLDTDKGHTPSPYSAAYLSLGPDTNEESLCCHIS
jgi:hypothetical protein